jgi:hypothetical protein
MPGPIGKSSITVLEAPLITGQYGRQVRDWDSATETVLPGVTVDIDSGSESTDAQDQTTTQATAFLPRGASVSEHARVVWAGRTWEVDGVPAVPEGAGPLGGPVVRLLEVAG